MYNAFTYRGFGFLPIFPRYFEAADICQTFSIQLLLANWRRSKAASVTHNFTNHKAPFAQASNFVLRLGLLIQIILKIIPFIYLFFFLQLFNLYMHQLLFG